MRNKRTLRLTAFLAVMLASLMVMASSAMAAPPVSNSGDPDVDVQLSANVNDSPAVFSVTEIATDPDGDPLELAGAGSPCGYESQTEFNYTPLGVGDQETCEIDVKDDGGTPSDSSDDSQITVKVNITTGTGGPPLDVEDPVVHITAPDNGASINTNSVVIHYEATDNVGIASCNVGDGDSVSLTPGANQITVNCGDAVGNIGSDTVNVTYDATAPVITITSPANNSTTSSSSVTLQFTATDDIGVASCNRSSGSSVPLNSGSNTITVSCQDAAGNASSKSVVVTYTPPPITLTVSNATVTEGDPGQPAVYADFKVQLSRPSQRDIHVSYVTIPLTAGLKDIKLVAATLVIQAGQTTGHIYVQILADTKMEAKEYFGVAWGSSDLDDSCDIDALGVAIGTIVEDANG